MGSQSTDILVVGVDRERYARFAPLLERREFEVNRVPSSRAAQELLTSVRFESFQGADHDRLRDFVERHLDSRRIQR